MKSLAEITQDIENIIVNNDLDGFITDDTLNSITLAITEYIANQKFNKED